MSSVEVAARQALRGWGLASRLHLAVGRVMQALRLALGPAGVTWAVVAAIFGIASTVVSLAVVARALHAPEAETFRRKSVEILTLDLNTRRLMGAIHLMTYERAKPQELSELLAERRRAYDDAYLAACGREPAAAPPADPVGERRAEVCRASQAMRTLLLPELDSFDPPRRPLDKARLAQVIDQLDPFNIAVAAALRDFDRMTGALVEDYDATLLVLFVSRLGFVAAGVVLVVLLARASIHHHVQLRAAEQASGTLRETLELLPAGVVLYDAQERLTLFNSTAADVTPLLRRPDAIGRSYEELVRERVRIMESAGRDSLSVAKALAEFRSKSARRLRQHEDGRWFEWSERPTANGGTVGLRVDVTELKRREEQIERGRAEYQALLGSLSDMVFRTDLGSGLFTFVGGAAERVFGAPARELVGQPLLMYVAPEDATQVHNIGRDAYRSTDRDAVRVLRFRVVTSTGEERHVEARVRRSDEPGGQPAISGVIRDIDDQTRLAEQVLRETARLRSIVESSGAMVALLDGDLVVTMVNSGFTALGGIAEADAVGRPLQSVMPCPLDEALLERWRTAEQGDRAPIRFAVKLGEGTQQHLVAITATPVLDSNGTVASVVLLGVDDTERRDAEQALYDTERYATVGEMAATMAHEISQPLQVINIACASAVEELTQPVSPDGATDVAFVRAKLDRIAQQVTTAGRIIGDLRAFVRGTAADKPGPFDAAAAVQSASDLAQHGLRQAGMTLGRTIAPGLPRVAGEAGRLEQVLVNLINNARDAGGRALEIKVDAASVDGRRYVRLVVEDNGPGIPAHVLPRLFVAFVSTKRGKGTGLGLRICRRILEEMGGSITAANRPEGGARFEILLPAET